MRVQVFQERDDRPLTLAPPCSMLVAHDKMVIKNGGGMVMGEQCCRLMVGDMVPDFTIETYEPEKGDFGEVSLGALKTQKKWTVLFFYPADFTFV